MISSVFSTLLSYFLTDLLVLSAIYFLGHILSSFCLSKPEKDNNWKSEFAKLGSGIFGVVFIYAQIRSGFFTILLLVYPVLIFLIGYAYLIPKQPGIFHKAVAIRIPLRQMAISAMRISIICAIIMGAFGFVLWNSDAENFRVPHFDFIAYSNISNTLNITGRENSFYQLFLCSGYPAETQNSLYHFPELWMNSLMIFLTGKASALTFFFCTVPVLLTAVVTGLLALCEKYTAISYRAVITVLFFLNFGGVYLPFYDKFLITDFWGGLFNPNFISHPKYCFSALVFIGSLLLLLEDLPVYSLIFLLLLPVVNVGHLIPVITGGLLFALVIYTMGYSQLSRRDLVAVISSYLIFSIFYLAYNRIFCNALSNEAFSHNFIIDLVNSPKPLFFVRTFASDVAHLLARGVLLYFPAAITLLFIYGFDKSVREHLNRKYLLLAGLAITIVTMGIFGSFLITNVPDYIQLFYNSLPLLNIALIPLFISLVERFKNLHYLSRAGLVCVFALMFWSLSYNVHCRFEESICRKYNEYGNYYMEKVISIVNSGEQKIGVYWTDERVYQNMTYIYTQYDRPAPFLCLNDSFSDLIELNNFYTTGNSGNTDLDLLYLKNTPFQRYLKHHSPNAIWQQMPALQDLFIRENRITYGFTDQLKNIPPEVNARINYVLRDSISGEYFVQFGI